MVFFRILIFLILISPILSNNSIHYSQKGYVASATIHQLSDGSIIKLPYRILNYDPVLSYSDFTLITSVAIEFRLKEINQFLESDLNFDLREFYVEWLNPMGELSIGKQIISWGMGSENNPTDIISPFNYYYLFSTGKDRKEGILSLNSMIYWRDLLLNFIFIPQHSANILPLGDPEFSISSPIIPKDEQIKELETPREYGVALRIPINIFEITTSYFSGFDRTVSFFGVNLWTGQWTNPDAIKQDIVLSYRHTKMFGIGAETIIDNMSIKFDLGYFRSDDQTIPRGDSTLFRIWETGIEQIIKDCEELNLTTTWDPDFIPTDCSNDPRFNNSEIIDNKAEYYQYLFELEYSPTNELNIIGQISGSQLISIGEADSIRTSGGTIMFDPNDYFVPGLGAPNNFISNSSFAITTIKSFTDLGLEFRYLGLIDLNKKGVIQEIGLEKELLENTYLTLAINKILSNMDIQDNQFTNMEDFSHFRLELKYYY